LAPGKNKRQEGRGRQRQRCFFFLFLLPVRLRAEGPWGRRKGGGGKKARQGNRFVLLASFSVRKKGVSLQKKKEEKEGGKSANVSFLSFSWEQRGEKGGGGRGSITGRL